MKNYPRIVFFGTPEFAVVSLDRLIGSGFPVVAVVTARDKPSGRGLQEKASAVKEYAQMKGIAVLQPVNMKDPAFLDQLSQYKPDLQIVIAFRMMPRQIWSLPVLGTFNLHASLLPQYKGAAPINRAIINGECETGVTTFFLNEQIDSGQIILSEKVSIGPEETAGELHDRLMVIGAELVIRTVEKIISGGVKEHINEAEEASGNDPAVLKPASKIFREDCKIDWSQPVEVVHNFIRGLSPYPGAFTYLKMADGTNQILKILKSTAEPVGTGVKPGRIITDGKKYIKIATADGFIHVGELQLSGRKAMNSVDFLRGARGIIPETLAI